MRVRPGAPTPAIRWLHIADLQLGARPEAEVAQFLAELLDSLTRRPPAST